MCRLPSEGDQAVQSHPGPSDVGSKAVQVPAQGGKAVKGADDLQGDGSGSAVQEPSGSKLLFVVPVDWSKMKFTTGLRMSARQRYKSRLHRAGTGGIKGQKPLSARQKIVKRMDTEERSRKSLEDEGMLESDREVYTPLGAITPGLGGGFPCDPCCMHAGWCDEAISTPGVLAQTNLPPEKTMYKLFNLHSLIIS